jgi:glycosyltransferase involved in cell wall biosynthesis
MNPEGRFNPADKRICVVTGELAGPDYNGGIGTANRGLAIALRAQGYQVDVLYTRVDRDVPFCFRGTFADQVEAFRRLGIGLMCIRHAGEWNDWLAKSYRAMEHLAGGRYDFAFFNDTSGTAYYPLLARRTGSPQLARTIMCLVTHSATQWIAELNESLITSIEDIRVMELERRSIELADIVMSPSAYLLKRYLGYGWKLPEVTFVKPNILPEEERRRLMTRRRVPIDEIVFFGRLERRKGLWMFCKALDHIKYRLVGRAVTFLGKFTCEDGESTGFSLLRRSAAWPFEVRLLHSFDREQALNYLKGGRRLALMPSREDNSPCAILECLCEGIPFLASSGSGGEELLSAESRQDCLFEPTVDALCRKLLTVFEQGMVTGLPSFDPNRNEEAIMQWLADVLSAGHGPSGAAAPSAVTGSWADAPEPLPILLVLVPASLNPQEAISRIGRIVELYQGKAELTVLTPDPARLSSEFDDAVRYPSLRVVDIRSYAEIVASRARGPTIAAVCHVTQPIVPAWLDRARLCLAPESDIVALTGLVATEDADLPHATPPFVSLTEKRRAIARYLVGNSPALFPLGQETNSGFVALRSDMLPLLAASPPFDPQYGRLKRMGDWVHELLVSLHAQGRRFEVLPDCTLDEAVKEDGFEVFRLGGLMRSLVASQLGYPPGSEQALLARLALEVMLKGEKRKSSADCLAYLTEKLGRPLAEPGLYDGSDDTYGLLATMAQASGQSDLALELVAQPLIPEALPGPLKASGIRPAMADHVRRRADEISLIDLADKGGFEAVNLMHEWSFKLLSPDRELEIHPNPAHEGRASIVFPALDLGRVDRLTGTVRVQGSAAHPVRFRVDIIACDRAGHFSFERIVAAGETERFDVAFPEATHRLCNVVLGTEMANPSDSPRDACARWLDPTFTRGETG